MTNYKHTIQYYETDKMGITHHSNYIRFMEEARIHFLKEAGWPYDKLEEEGFVITVHGKGTYVAATDMQLAAEARRKAVEDDLAVSIQRAAAIGLSKEEITEIVQIILEDC